MNMPSCSWANDASHSYNFEAAFFDRRHAEACGSTAPPPDATAHGPAYAPARPPGTEVRELRQEFMALNRVFLESPEGRRARDEWTATLASIVDFARSHRLTAAVEQLARLSRFREAHAGPKVDGEIDLYRPDYKPWMEALARLIGNERIDLRARCEALLRLDDLDRCTAAQGSEFRSQAMWLEGLSGGLGNSAWSAYAAVAMEHLRDLLRQEPELAGLDLSTPHVLHPFAAALRLPGFSRGLETTDAFVINIQVHQGIIDRCAVALRQRVSMTAIAERLADDCLQAIHQALTLRLGGRPFDILQGPGHWGLLNEVLEDLMPRFGPLDTRMVTDLDEDHVPQRLTNDPRLLTLGIRHNMARQGIAPPPLEEVLDDRVVDKERRRIMLFEREMPYVLLGEISSDGTGRRRLPDRQEIAELLNARAVRGMPSAALGPQVRATLQAFLDTQLTRSCQSDPEQVRARVADRPTREGLDTVLGRQGLDDPARARWLREAAPHWPADALDHALDRLVGDRGAASLAALLDAWRTEGFSDSWHRQVRRQATRLRLSNTDARFRGRDVDGYPEGAGGEADLRSPQGELLDRIERQFGGTVPLANARAALRAFLLSHPIGGNRQRIVDSPSFERALQALGELRAGPARLLTVPLLLQDAGLSEALESTFYQGSPQGLAQELALVLHLADRLAFDSEEIAALLRVTDRQRLPVPSPLLSAALLNGRHFLMAPIFEWTSTLFWEERLGASAARRILMPDALEAEQARTQVRPAAVQQALSRYLSLLDSACEMGLLRPRDLAEAAGRDTGTPTGLLRAAAQRGGPGARDLLEAWCAKYR